MKAGRAGIEPTSSVLETDVLAAELPTHKAKSAGVCEPPRLAVNTVEYRLRGWTPTSRREQQIGNTQVKFDQTRRIGPLVQTSRRLCS